MSIISNEHQHGSPFDKRPEHPCGEAEMPGPERFKFDLLGVIGEVHGDAIGSYSPPQHPYMAERVNWLRRRLQYWHKSERTYDLLVFTLANEALAMWNETERQRERGDFDR